MAKFVFGKMTAIKRLNIVNVLCLFIMFFSLVSCVNRAESGENENAKDDIFYIPDLSLAYKLPTNVYNWVIVPDENLKPEIKFCCFETENNIHISVIKPDCGDCKFQDLTETTLNNLVGKLIFGEDNDKEISLSEVYASKFLENYSWRFKTIVPFEIDGIMVEVAYIGYLYNDADNITCIMATIPNEQLMKMQPDTFEKYFSSFFTTDSFD